MQKAVRFVGNSFVKHDIREYSRFQTNVDLSTVNDWMIPVAAAGLAEEIETGREPTIAFLQRRLDCTDGQRSADELMEPSR